MYRFGFGARRVAGRAAPTSPITAGTILTKSPLTTGSVTTQAHGLGAEPTYLKSMLECITADNAWDIGDRIEIGASALMDGNPSDSRGLTIAIDATNVRLIIDIGTFFLNDEDGTSGFVITLASWKCEITPYLFSV